MTVIFASHSVPYGKVYKQWNTKGRRILWINRGLIADVMKPFPGVGVKPWPPLGVLWSSSGLVGIPVYYV